jgi:2-oxoisovalerate dehydrogenase E2 component (dihydrolipoyl transacylase)
MPALAESVVEGEILKWLVQEGDEIKLDQPVVEIMTDKVTTELPAPFAGRLEKILAAEGSIVAVGAAMAVIVEGSSLPVQAQPEQLPIMAREERSIIESGASINQDLGEVAAVFAKRSSNSTNASSVSERSLAVPAARKLARESGLSIEDVPGSGPNGRVRVDDVQNFLEKPQKLEPQRASTSGLNVSPISYRTPAGYESLETRTPLRGMRRAISQQMLASHLYTVRTLHVDECDMTELVRLRERLNAQSPVKISYLPFIFRALAVALKRYPSLNSSFDEATQEIVQKQYYHLGMAVATDAGLIVPVLRNVDRKSLLEIAQEIHELAGKARDGKLSPDELSGGTFSVTNMGTIGALFSFPIINVPEAAILGVHSIQKRPVVLEYAKGDALEHAKGNALEHTKGDALERDGEDVIVIRQMMYLSLSFDHRLIDGADAARFCGLLIDLLEQPERLLLESQ